MLYFTALRRDQVVLLPSFCNYIIDKYKPVKKEFLLAPSRGVNPRIYHDMIRLLNQYNDRLKSSLDIIPIRSLYPVHFEYNDLSKHPGVVLLPYQVSIMSLFEFYRMEIPIFVPSTDLLTGEFMCFNILFI